MNSHLSDWIGPGLAGAVTAALFLTTLILIKSIKDFSQAGPKLPEEIRRHYRPYAIFATGRLVLWSLLITFLMALVGIVVYASLCILGEWSFSFWISLVVSMATVVAITLIQFAHYLLYAPGIIAASSNYRLSRLYWLWTQLSPRRLRFLRSAMVIVITLVVGGAIHKLSSLGAWQEVAGITAIVTIIVSLYLWATLSREPNKIKNSRRARVDNMPNILMIGCDTLRADRVCSSIYPRRLTPFIDELLEAGTLFSNCYVPLARTAPSLASYMTGTWPHRHGIRDNFSLGNPSSFPTISLPKLLADVGYETIAISDWAGSDFGKYDFGFRRLDVPEDQWNIRHYIRQGPKDLRLFLSLFTHNRFGKTFLPEIYYLAGAPLSSHLGRRTRHSLTKLASGERPFLLNVFMGTCHPPFGSEYPYYTMYTDPAYNGQSKFAMSKLTDPMEIIRSQQEPKEAFDLDQIVNLYDGCVRNFDEEVRKILTHLDHCGLQHNTVVVIYSDHGMEFFEHDTWGQGNSAMGDFSARVPLLILDPRRSGRGRCKRVVRTIDLAPTLLELVGLPVPAQMQGVSLVPALEDPETQLELAAFFETGTWLATQPGTHPDHMMYPDILELLEVSSKKAGTLVIKPRYEGIVIEARDRMIRAGKWLLVYLPFKQGARYKLFNIQDDPQCLHEVSKLHPDILEHLKQQLVTWLTDDREREWRNEHLVTRSSVRGRDEDESRGL